MERITKPQQVTISRPITVAGPHRNRTARLAVEKGKLVGDGTIRQTHICSTILHHCFLKLIAMFVPCSLHFRPFGHGTVSPSQHPILSSCLNSICCSSSKDEEFNFWQTKAFENTEQQLCPELNGAGYVLGHSPATVCGVKNIFKNCFPLL